MHFTTAELGALVGSFLWPLIRVGAFVAAMPVVSIRGMPMQIRLVFALCITVVIAPTIPPVPEVDPISGDGIMIVIHQLIIGISMGFALRLVFSALVSAGQVIALGMGLGFASMVDPSNGVQVPVVSMFYMIAGTLLFLALDGHLVAIQVLAESFHTLPIGPRGLAVSGFFDLVMWGSWVFIGAVLISLPAITAILAVNIGFGVMARAAPQLNIFAVGFPVIMMVGFFMMFLTFPNIQPHFASLTTDALELMRRIVAKSA